MRCLIESGIWVDPNKKRNRKTRNMFRKKCEWCNLTAQRRMIREIAERQEGAKPGELWVQE